MTLLLMSPGLCLGARLTASGPGGLLIELPPLNRQAPRPMLTSGRTLVLDGQCPLQ